MRATETTSPAGHPGDHDGSTPDNPPGFIRLTREAAIQERQAIGQTLGPEKATVVSRFNLHLSREEIRLIGLKVGQRPIVMLRGTAADGAIQHACVETPEEATPETRDDALECDRIIQEANGTRTAPAIACIRPGPEPAGLQENQAPVHILQKASFRTGLAMEVRRALERACRRTIGIKGSDWNEYMDALDVIQGELTHRFNIRNQGRRKCSQCGENLHCQTCCSRA